VYGMYCIVAMVWYGTGRYGTVRYGMVWQVLFGRYCLCSIISVPLFCMVWYLLYLGTVFFNCIYCIVLQFILNCGLYFVLSGLLDVFYCTNHYLL